MRMSKLKTVKLATDRESAAPPLPLPTDFVEDFHFDTAIAEQNNH